MEDATYAASFGNRGKGHRPRNAVSFYKLEKARKGFSLRVSRRNIVLEHTYPVTFISDF